MTQGNWNAPAQNPQQLASVVLLSVETPRHLCEEMWISDWSHYLSSLKDQFDSVTHWSFGDKSLAEKIDIIENSSSFLFAILY